GYPEGLQEWCDQLRRLVWVEPCRSISVLRMAAYGASFSLPHLPAKVSSLNAERPLSLGGALAFNEKASFELSGRCRLGAASEVDEGVAPQTGIGRAAGTSVASFRRFWAVAARWNSSRAPLGPRSRSRSSFKMRLRCANSISTFLRWRREA